MKKALSLLLALVLCLSLCACGEGTQSGEKTESTTPSAESISVATLFEDVTNEAKCTLNIGKQVTVLGQIQEISANYCKIKLVSHPDKSVHIRLPIERLAELSVGNFIAVTGIVEAYNWSAYTISATETLDENAMDDIFQRIVAINFTYDLCNKAYFFKGSLNILCDYISQRSDRYTMANSEDLKEYLCGTWDCGSYQNSLQESSFTSFNITYNEDGSAKYSIQKSWRHDWEVDDQGRLHSFFGEKRVYILSDNVFFCDGALPYVFVRQYPICFRTITLSDKDTANYVLKLWQDGEATDNSMKELMDEYGADQGGGQLYELYPIDKDMFLDEIAGWCLDYSRMAGDAEIIRTDYGYAIVYIVSLNNG